MPGGALFAKLGEMAAANPGLAKAAVKYGVGAAAVVPLAVPLYWRTLKGVWGGKSLATSTLDAALDEDFSRTGVRGTVKKVVAGQDAADQSFGEIVVDEIGGQGTFAATRDVIGNTVDGAGNALAYAGGLVKGGVDSTREMASTIQSGLTAMVDQHFGPSGQQQMSPEQVQAQQAAIYQAAVQQGYFPQSYPQGAQMGTQGGSMLGGVGSTLSNLVNSFTGGGSNNIALAGLLAGAYMLFGGLGGGILSKVIGGVMGGYAFRSLAKGSSQPQQAMLPSVSPGQFQSRLQDNYEQQMQQYERQQRQDNSTTVMRTV